MTNRTDNFNRADSTTSLGTPSDSGSAWTTYQSTLGILSNTAYDVAHSVYGVAGLQSSISDCAVQVTCSAQGNMSCAARLADKSNFLTAGGDGSGNLSIYKIVAASFTQLASGTATQAAGDVFKFTVNGTALELFLNSVSKLTAASNVGQTNTIHGIFDFLSASARFDDFSITALGGGLTATGITVGTPVVGTSTISQKQALAATGIATGVPALGTPTIGAAVNALTATGFATSIPVIGSPTVKQKQAFSATGIATQKPVIGTSTISQKQVLSASGIATGIPILGIPILNAAATALTATGIATPTPVLDTPTLDNFPSAVIRGAPVWWRSRYDEEEEEEKPDVVNEIGIIEEAPHETPTEPEAIARSVPLRQEPRISAAAYSTIEARVRNAMAPELVAMRDERVKRRIFEREMEVQVKRRAKRMRDDEEVLLLS